MACRIRRARLECPARRALFTFFITGPASHVRYLVTVPPYNLSSTAANLFAVCFIGGLDAVVPVYDDESLIHGIEDTPDELLALQNLILSLFALRDVLAGSA